MDSEGQLKKLLARQAFIEQKLRLQLTRKPMPEEPQGGWQRPIPSSGEPSSRPHCPDLSLEVSVAAISGPPVLDTVLDHSNLTRRQLLMYTGQKLHPEALLYGAVRAVTLSGIDPVLFQQSFQTLLNSCDALRTVIEERMEVPHQRVLPPFPFITPFVDMRQGQNPRIEADAWMHQRCQVPFDMAQRLFDTALLRTSQDEYIWYLNVHHTVADGWSLDLLIQQLVDLCRIGQQGALPDHLALPSFQEYVVHERARRQSPAYCAAESYWRNKLAKPFEPIPFYGNKPRDALTQQARVSVNLGAERWTRLKALITRNDVFIKSLEATMTNTFASLLFMYLYRISGLRRLSIGVVFHNRLTQVQKETVGLFMEVLPFVVTIRPEESFLGLIQRVHQEAREALQHRQYSVGNPVHTPAHTVLLHFTRSMQLNETLVGVQRIHSGHGESSLSLSVIDPGCMEDLELWFDCRTDLFDPAIIDRMVGHFLTLLDAVVGNPDQPISQLPLLTETERHQLLVDWNNTRKDYPGNLRIHQLFESQVARTPEAVAVVLEENQLTYRELNHRANQLACHLRVLGVRPDVLVGVYMERSLELLVALVGILKAGGAYVPLDPDYPEERLRFMLEDTRAPVLLTQERLARQLPKQASRLFLLDSGWETVAKECEEDPVNVAEPDSLAYVIYTSGSTGRPKGVMICHRSVCNHLLWRHEYFPLTDKDRLLQKASPNFDDSVWEFFEPLMVGARLIMTPPGKQQDSAYLVQLIADQQITAACFVPSMLQVLLEEPGLERCGCLRRMTTGGELLSVALQNRFSSYLDADLYNGYGPTEATISASFWHCQHGEHGRVVPIGRPIANTQIYLLDSNLQPVPVGVPGEIYIGGAGVARGYLNLPELTAENFIAHPYTHEPGARLYRTGDLARYRPDGNLEFLGRMDSQVKIRGFRVELGEIETVLSQHPAVEQSLVILEEDLSGNKRLVAYLVGLHSPAPSASELRSFLSRRLPNYMIPAAFVSLETFPRLPNGKVDRRALLALGAARPERERGFAEPRTPLEREVAGIWEEMLGLARVGIYEDFFELGGDSLLATQLISRMRSIFHIELPLRRLFEAPTVADLSEALLLRLAEKAESAEMDR